MTPAPALCLEGITKKFGDYTALDDVSFEAKAGEIHALLGENGAGKSTLMNVAGGLYAPDRGVVRIANQLVTLHTPADAAKHGIGMVHQHFKLVPAFTGLDNLALFDPQRRSMDDLRKRAQTLCRQGKFEVDLDRQVHTLPVAQQQRLEILKVLLTDASIIILDEPTAVLTDEEGHALMRFARGLAQAGAAVILVTHKLYEALDYCDRITVMRAGHIVGQTEPGAVDHATLTEMIVGKAVENDRKPAAQPVGPWLLELNDASALAEDGRAGLVEANLRLYQGEIYGVAGVSGNGQDELAAVIAGLLPLQSGQLAFAGLDGGTSNKPHQRRKNGMAVIPVDRYRDALAGDLSLVENWAISGTLRGRFGSWAWFARSRAQKAASDAFAANDVQGIQHLNQRASLLSGGNAQKLVIAREFFEKPKLVLAQSPSRGLDVQAGAAVHARLRAARDDGAAVLLISDDLDEVMLLADRIGVLSRGRIVREFDMPVDRSAIGRAMVGYSTPDHDLANHGLTNHG